MPPKDKWRRVPRKGLWAIVRNAIQDKNTQAGGSGPIGRFESRFCKMTQTKHGLLMNSGTATLHSAYLACGVAPGDEVIVPSYTFFASAAPILACGAKPVFCEVDPEHVDNGSRGHGVSDYGQDESHLCRACLGQSGSDRSEFKKSPSKETSSLLKIARTRMEPDTRTSQLAAGAILAALAYRGLSLYRAAKWESPLRMMRCYTTECWPWLTLAGFKPAWRQTTFKVGGFSYGLKYRPHLYGVLLANASLDRLDELNRLRRQKLSRSWVKSFEGLSQRLASSKSSTNQLEVAFLNSF